MGNTLIGSALGSTQINASDLRAIPVPPTRILDEIGRRPPDERNKITTILRSMMSDDAHNAATQTDQRRPHRSARPESREAHDEEGASDDPLHDGDGTPVDRRRGQPPPASGVTQRHLLGHDQAELAREPPASPGEGQAGRRRRRAADEDVGTRGPTALPHGGAHHESRADEPDAGAGDRDRRDRHGRDRGDGRRYRRDPRADDRRRRRRNRRADGTRAHTNTTRTPGPQNGPTDGTSGARRPARINRVRERRPPATAGARGERRRWPRPIAVFSSSSISAGCGTFGWSVPASEMSSSATIVRLTAGSPDRVVYDSSVTFPSPRSSDSCRTATRDAGCGPRTRSRSPIR